MEQQTNRGGKRKGAGRKPVLSKKKQISLYVEGSKILKFGNEEKYKDFLYRKTDEFGNEELNTEINYLPTSPTAYDAAKVSRVTHDEPAMWQEAKPVTFKSVTEWVQEKRQIEDEDEFIVWEKKLDADTLLTDKQKKLIKIS